MKLEMIQQLFVKNPCIRYLKNLMAGIVTNTRSHIEGSLLSQHYFLHGKEYQKSDLHTGIKVPFPVW